MIFSQIKLIFFQNMKKKYTTKLNYEILYVKYIFLFEQNNYFC